MAISKRKRVHAFWLMAALPLCAKAAAPVEQAVSTSVVPHSAASEAIPTFALGAGVVVSPLYEGSSRYAVFPSLVAKAVMPTENWGTFTAAFPEGLRWDLPNLSTFGVALLVGYDPGRKEKIRTLGGHNSYLKGMGDLDNSAMVGAEAYWGLSASRLFVRGWQATRSREYGGEDLGHTAYLEAGASSALPLSSALTLDSALYGTWGDKDDMMAHFGVTGEQAARTDFREYHTGGGMRDVTLKTGLTWQLQPHLALQGGMKLYALTAGARRSPLTDNSVGAGFYLNALYQF
ncbi:MipA/OmpV family protein [Serratia liquefaciens]|jgi:outer membrane protein|uniref:MipA/OmpV family protein n=1 Tax=Serratia liquefaciens TaxID=614 RepID=UPI0032DF8E16